MAASERTSVGDPTGLHRVLDEAAVLPQAAQRLDTRRDLWPDEVRVRVERLNLDAASFRQLERKHTKYGEKHGDAVRAEVLDIVATRGKMQNPETGSGGMLVGTCIGVVVIPGLYYIFAKIADKRSLLRDTDDESLTGSVSGGDDHSDLHH